jgi:hypothetical protein
LKDLRFECQKPLQFSKEEVQKKDVEEAQKQHSMQALT